MTFTLRIEHQPDGLRLRFPEPLATLDMSSETASHLASLLAVEARSRLVGVVRTLETRRTGDDGFNPVRAENASTSVVRMLPQPKTPIKHSDREWLENKAIRVQDGSHLLCCTCDRCLHGETPLNGDHDHG